MLCWAISRVCWRESNRRFQQQSSRAINRAKIRPTSTPSRRRMSNSLSTASGGEARYSRTWKRRAPQKLRVRCTTWRTVRWNSFCNRCLSVVIEGRVAITFARGTVTLASIARSAESLKELGIEKRGSYETESTRPLHPLSVPGCGADDPCRHLALEERPDDLWNV